MEKKIAGLLGAMATLGAFTAADAAPITNPAPAEILNANSFADLLEPIPNAVELLQVVDEAGPIPSAQENIQQVQFYHHHHHHHHSQYRRFYDEPRVVIVPRRYRHHHHHHHHHHSFYRRDYY